MVYQWSCQNITNPSGSSHWLRVYASPTPHALTNYNYQLVLPTTVVQTVYCSLLAISGCIGAPNPSGLPRPLCSVPGLCEWWACPLITFLAQYHPYLWWKWWIKWLLLGQTGTDQTWPRLTGTDLEWPRLLGTSGYLLVVLGTLSYFWILWAISLYHRIPYNTIQHHLHTIISSIHII